MIHIVFNESDVAVLEQAIALDEGLTGDVIQIKDEFSVGPLQDIYQQEGIDARNEWWRMVIKGSDIEGKADDGSIDDQRTVKELIDKLEADAEEKIWIWAAQNKYDVSGYYWLLPFFKEYQGSVYILYLNNLPFINEKGNIFYPNWLHEIPAKEFLKARKLAREITLSEFEVDPDEWNKLMNENKGVRLLEGGKKTLQTNREKIAAYAALNEDENDSFRAYLTGLDGAMLDERVHDLSKKISAEIDCTLCGACCKNLMINLNDENIQPVANKLNISSSEFKNRYVEESLQGQLIMNTIPCHFLHESKCSVYTERFTECREFPHLHKNNFKGRLFGTLMHYAMCPIVFNVIEALKVETGFESLSPEKEFR